MLVVDAHALEAVHFLDFVHQVGGEVLLALGAQDVVQLGVAFGQQVAALDEVAVGHGDVLALGHQVFLGFAHFRRDDELALALGFAREGNGARDFGNHGHILGLADFEQLGDSRKTTHDVAGLGGFTRLTGDDVAREHLLAVLDHDDRADGEAVDRGELARAAQLGIAVFIADGDGRAEARRTVFDDGHGRLVRGFVQLFLIGLAVHEVRELDEAVHFRDEGFVERIPFGKELAVADGLPIRNVQARAVGERVALHFAALLVDDGDLPALAEHLSHTFAVPDFLHAGEDHAAVMLRLEVRTFDFLGRRTADVEGTHGELRAGFADGLCRDDADRLADVDEVAAGKVAPVAQRADAALGLAGQRGADHHGVDALVVQRLGDGFVDQSVFGVEQVARCGIIHRVEQHAAERALGQLLLDLAAVLDGADFDAVDGAAVVFGDDDVLHHVHEAAGQVTGVRRLEGGVRETLTSAVRGGKVLEHRQAFTEARGDRGFDDFAGGLGHQAAHTGELTHLVGVASGTRVGHHEDRVEAEVGLLLAGLRVGQDIRGDFLVHFRGHVLRGLGPNVDDLVVFFRTGDDTVAVLAFDVVHFGGSGINDALLGIGDQHVLHADTDAGAGRVFVPDGLDAVAEDDARLDPGVAVGAVHQLGNVLFGQFFVDVLELDAGGQAAPHEDTAGRGVGELAVFHAYLDTGVHTDLIGVKGGFHFPRGAEDHAFALFEGTFHGHVIQAEDHVLGRHDDGRSVGGRQDVVGAHHEHAAFDLRFHGERDVYGHLVAVEVRVVGGADERVQLDGLAFDEQRLEGLDAEAVQRRGAVQQNRVFLDHVGQDIPYDQLFALHHLFRALDGGGMASLLKFGIDEGLEKLERHLLGQAALMEFQVRAHDDDGTAGVVDALAEQVLTEAALLALDHVGQGLQGASVGAGDGASAAAVVEQRVHGFLQHTLFVTDDDVGSPEFHQAFQAVVTVDHAAVQVVQVGGGETAAVERNERAQLRRNDRDDFEDHPFGAVAGFEERFHDLEALGELLLFGLGLGGLRLFAQEHLDFLKVQLFEQAADGFRAHAHGKGVLAEMVDDLEVLVLGDDLHLLEVGAAGIEHDVRVEIEHLFQIGHGHVEQGADLGGQGLEEPDMGDGRGQFDMAHAFAAHLGGNDFNAALFADDAAVLHAFVLAAVAFVVLHRAEDLRAEQAVAFGLERTVVDGLRLLDFAVGPFADVLRRGDGNLNRLQIADLARVGVGRAANREEIVKTHIYVLPFAGQAPERQRSVKNLRLRTLPPSPQNRCLEGWT